MLPPNPGRRAGTTLGPYRVAVCWVGFCVHFDPALGPRHVKQRLGDIIRAIPEIPFMSGW